MTGDLLAQDSRRYSLQRVHEGRKSDGWRIMNQQVNVVLLAVELDHSGTGILAGIGHELVAAGKDWPGQRSSPVLGHKDQVDMKV